MCCVHYTVLSELPLILTVYSLPTREIVGAPLILSSRVLILSSSGPGPGADTESRKGGMVDFSGELNSLNRVPFAEKIIWAELHRKWDIRENKAWGKILLHYYAPDTKLFM